MATAAAATAYHHGDLRNALLATAVEELAEHGAASVSLRAIARRAGVSHAAPTHHFRDKAGLLTAVATQGYEMLGDRLAETAQRNPGLAEVGATYVRFAVEQPAHFGVMFSPELIDADDPGLIAARDRARTLLRAGTDDPVRALAAWSVVHGLASLLLDRTVTPVPPPDVGALARAVTAHLR